MEQVITLTHAERQEVSTLCSRKIEEATMEAELIQMLDYYNYSPCKRRLVYRASYRTLPVKLEFNVERMSAKTEQDDVASLSQEREQQYPMPNQGSPTIKMIWYVCEHTES